jgi:uncharacterized membrane protein
MNLERKLARWEEAGVIDAATRARIEAHERNERKPVVPYALAVLGAGTLALGILSVVAANWDAIPGSVKLACDLALGAVLAVATYRAATRDRRLTTEVLVTLFYGFTLASIALVGQVYQTSAPTYRALLVWSGSTLPLVLLGRSRFLAALVTAALALTHVTAVGALLEHLTEQGGLSEDTERNLVATVAFVSPLLYVPLARVPWLVRNRPEYARTLGSLAWTFVLLAGLAAQLLWYAEIERGDTLSWALALTALACALLAVALPRLHPELPAPSLRPLAAILGFGWLTFAAAAGIERGPAPFVGAILQVVWLGLFAWACLELRQLRVFNLLTALIALRVLVIYFEVFGSMLSTGVGLISGGLLTLLLAYVWRKQTRGLTERLGPPGASGPQASDGDVA